MKPKRDWTQYDIVAESTRRFKAGDHNLHYFNMLDTVADEAFGGLLEVVDVGTWQFPMNDITVGALIDFFARPMLRWHNETGGPTAYVSVEEEFREHFKVDWLTVGEMDERYREDLDRAWRTL